MDIVVDVVIDVVVDVVAFDDAILVIRSGSSV